MPPPRMFRAQVGPPPAAAGDVIVALLIVTSLSVVLAASEGCWMWSPTLLAKVIGPWTFRFWLPVPVPWTKMPSPWPPWAPEYVPPVTLRFSVPEELETKTSESKLFETLSFVRGDVPVNWERSIPLSPLALPLFVTDMLLSDRPTTLEPPIPSSPLLLTLIRVRSTPPATLVREIPVPVELWIAPPVQVAAGGEGPPFAA